MQLPQCFTIFETREWGGLVAQDATSIRNSEIDRHCKKMSANRDPKLKINRYKNQKKLSSEPAREARQHPGCCFELRRAKRAGAQTGIRLPGACIQPPGNKKMPAPETGARKLKKMSPAPDQMEQFSYSAPGVYVTFPGGGHFPALTSRFTSDGL